MATNDRIILDQVLKQRKETIAPEVQDAFFFEFFTAEQILKDFDLSYDEIESGLIGGGGDGGIDGIYLLVNGELVQDDPEYDNLKKDITIDLIITQSKAESGFSESTIDRFTSVSDDIFDLSKDSSDLSPIYNHALVEVVGYFHSLFQQLAARFPSLKVSFFYASKGIEPHHNVRRKVENLQKTVASHFPDAEFTFNFLGASQLLALARKTPQARYELALAESPISSEGQVGFVCLVRLRDFFSFMTDETGALLRHVFEANVRDYQGRTEVNDAIRTTLRSPTGEDFWWLNNGVSILATKASLGGKTLAIENPQIVNGLQTSTEVYNYCKNREKDGDGRKILIRVMVPEKEASRDRIIKATNSQTAIQRSSLRATDKIHRDIEEYLQPKGLFYDRRKNYYKNTGKPRDKIVSIPHLAQAVMAMVLRRPDTARARPSSLLKRDEDYSRVFDSSYPMPLYHVCAETMRRVEEHLRSPGANLEARDRNNLRFYVAMCVVNRLCDRRDAAAISELDLARVEPNEIQTSLDYVREKYVELGGNDHVAKGRGLLSAIHENAVSEVAGGLECAGSLQGS